MPHWWRRCRAGMRRRSICAWAIGSPGSPSCSWRRRLRACCSGGVRIDRVDDLVAGLDHRALQIVVALKVQPELRRRAEIAGQTQGDFAGNRPYLIDDGLHLRDRNKDVLGEAEGGKSERPHEFLPELFSGMEGRQIGLGHDYSLTDMRSSLGSMWV